MKTKTLLPITFLLAAASAFAQVNPAPPLPAKTFYFPVGPDGLVSNWLSLGYLPGRISEDRLASVGGEAKARPYGGQVVEIPGVGKLKWKTVRARKLEMPYYMYGGEGLTMFVDENGQPVEDATAYLYCELVSPEAQGAELRLTGGEPLRLWLNGTELGHEGRKRHFVGNGANVPVKLSQGTNRLLVRLENQRRDEVLALRLAGARGVRVGYNSHKDAPSLPGRYLAQDWDALISEIPDVPPSPDEAYFGANLSRTMALLESGGRTNRPVRIVFYGQSITAQEWTWFLVRRLRERYPKTTIEAENWAISGWGIHRLNHTIKHDVLRARPDLVILHAYNGGSWEWERILQKLRRETTADIMIRSPHLSRHEQNEPIRPDSSESLMLRQLARKYGCEMVEGRREWTEYIRTHKMDPENLRSDGVHLNRNGSILMAQLHERHFRAYPVWRPWFQTVRRYDAMRQLADNHTDEVRLSGEGWSIERVNYLSSHGDKDRLELTFQGNRVDLVMPQCEGKAKILVDGKPPSEWNLFHGTRPSHSPALPAALMTYHMGKDMVEEDWTLTFTHVSGDRKKFRYKVEGSVTGPDGEGSGEETFVSNSGRITILPAGFFPQRKGADNRKTELEPTTENWQIRWHVQPLFEDIIQGTRQLKGEEWRPRYNHPYRYKTIIDGLPPGEHVLTLLPIKPVNPNHTFALSAVEVHRPPLGE